MNWTKIEIQGNVVDGLINQGVLLGYVTLHNQSMWRLYRGDHQLFFQVYSKSEAMRVLEEVMKTA
jgi:hypothetical protein